MRQPIRSQASGVGQRIAQAAFLLAHQHACHLVGPALDVQGDRFELHAVFAHPCEGAVKAQGQQRQHHVFQAQPHKTAGAQVAL